MVSMPKKGNQETVSQHTVSLLLPFSESLTSDEVEYTNRIHRFIRKTLFCTQKSIIHHVVVFLSQGAHFLCLRITVQEYCVSEMTFPFDIFEE